MNEPFSWYDAIPPGARAALVALVTAQVALQVYCLLDLSRGKRAMVGKKWVWLLVILFGVVGVVVYLAFGRRATPACDDPVPRGGAHGDRARRAADLLYGKGGGRVKGAVGAAAIEIAGLTKIYAGARALDGLELVVNPGAVFGFLGPNGAGKTTTLRILIGLARPTSGVARMFGLDVVRAVGQVRRLLGYLPDVPGFYDWMTATEFLRFAGNLFGLSGRSLQARIEALLDLAGLTGVTTRVGGFSRGMKQRLGIAQALINAPQLLLLDEPTSALDPMGRKEVLEVIAALAGRTTVLFSTHILTDVERVCDTVTILNRGKVVTQGSLASLRSGRPGRVVSVEVTGGADRLAAALSGAPWLGSVAREDQKLRLSVRDLEAAERALPVALAQTGVGLRSMASGEVSLEEAFVELVGADR